MSYDGIICTWDGEALRPAGPYWLKKAQEAFREGARHEIVERKDASRRSRSHYFASLKEAHDNLPDVLLSEYPTVEHLRKKMLIKAGFCSHRDFVTGSSEEAHKLAAFLVPMNRYSIIIVDGPCVRILSAASQNENYMSHTDFQSSKAAVLDEVAKLLNVTVPELANARAS